MVRRDEISEHIRHSLVSSISNLSPYSAIILSMVLVVLFLIRFYILQGFLLQKLHGAKYTQLDDVRQRSFLNHYIAGATKFTILIVAVYPAASVAFGVAGFHTPLLRGSRVTMGDLLLIGTQMLTGMFIFELIYRVKISPMSATHHIASIMVAQVAITISVKGDEVSSIEFMLCTVWGRQIFLHCPRLSRDANSPPTGTFDIIAEFIPHVALILYRVYPTSHSFLANIFKFACITTLIGTVSETILIMYIFGILWNRWPLSFKILTPMLHIAFSAAQFHGTRIFYQVWRKQERQLKEAKDSENEDNMP